MQQLLPKKTRDTWAMDTGHSHICKQERKKIWKMTETQSNKLQNSKWHRTLLSFARGVRVSCTHGAQIASTNQKNVSVTSQEQSNRSLSETIVAHNNIQIKRLLLKNKKKQKIANKARHPKSKSKRFSTYFYLNRPERAYISGACAQISSSASLSSPTCSSHPHTHTHSAKRLQANRQCMLLLQITFPCLFSKKRTHIHMHRKRDLKRAKEEEDSQRNIQKTKEKKQQEEKKHIHTNTHNNICFE